MGALNLQLRRARDVSEQLASVVEACACPACTGAPSSAHCGDCDCSICEPPEDFCLVCLGPCTGLCWGDDV
jgi:hypothetical protein